MSTSYPALPPPGVPAIYVGTAQGQRGPLPIDVVLQEMHYGQLPGDALIWFDGLANWIRPIDHPELRARLSPPQAQQTPPPPIATAPPVASPLAGRSDDDLDRLFVGLIHKSWDYFNTNLFAAHVDDVFLGAVIASTLDNGYSLIDLTSDGSNHFLRFQQMQDQTRIICRLHHLTHSTVEAKVIGHMASVTFGYGERVANAGRLWGALKAEFKSGYIRTPEPGTITVDADVGSGYIYTQVDQFWNIGDYIAEDFSTNQQLLTEHIGVTIHALRKYLRGRIT